MLTILHRDRPAGWGTPPTATQAGRTTLHHLQRYSLSPTSTEAQDAFCAVSRTPTTPGMQSARKSREGNTRFCSELSQESLAALEFQAAGSNVRVVCGSRDSASASAALAVTTPESSAGHRHPGLGEPKRTLLLCFTFTSFLFNVTVKIVYRLKICVL